MSSKQRHEEPLYFLEERAPQHFLLMQSDVFDDTGIAATGGGGGEYARANAGRSSGDVALLRATLAERYLQGCYAGEDTRLVPSLEVPQSRPNDKEHSEGTDEMDVFAYLERVRAEEGRIPTVVSAKVQRSDAEQSQDRVQVTAIGTSKKPHPLLHLPVMANEYDVALHPSMWPSEQWQRNSVAAFADARIFLARWETRDICERFGYPRPQRVENGEGVTEADPPALMSISLHGGAFESGSKGKTAASVSMPMRSSDKPQRFLPLPPFRDSVSWQYLCFGAPGRSVCEGEAGGESGGQGRPVEKDGLAFSCGLPPLASILLQIDQPGIYKLLKLHVTWMQRPSSSENSARRAPPPLSRAMAAWLYGLLARMDKPLPPAKAATMRDLLRELKKRRSFVCATTLAGGTLPAERVAEEGNAGIANDKRNTATDKSGDRDGITAERRRQEALRLARINLLISVIEISFGQGDQY